MLGPVHCTMFALPQYKADAINPVQAVSGKSCEQTHCSDEDSKLTLRDIHMAVLARFSSERCTELLSAWESWLCEQAKGQLKFLQVNIDMMRGTQKLWRSGTLDATLGPELAQAVKVRDPADILWLKSQQRAISWVLDNYKTCTGNAWPTSLGTLYSLLTYITFVSKSHMQACCVATAV